MTSPGSLSPSLTRITTAGALGAAMHIGKGDPDKVDQTAPCLPSGTLEWSTTNLKFKDFPIYKQIT